MTLFGQYGQFKIWSRYTNGLSEFQVREGNRILSRHVRLLAAMKDAEARNEAFWDEQAAYLKAHRAELAQ